jgi:hypothetical protein
LSAASIGPPPRAGFGGDERGHRGDQIVDPLIIIEAADKADHRLARHEAEVRSERIIARWRVAEQVKVDAIGRDDDLRGIDAARDQVAAQSFADHRDGIGGADGMTFELAGQKIARAALAARAVADRGILPEGANFVDHRNSEPFADAQRREPVENGRVGVEQIGAPFIDQRRDAVRQRADFAPFAPRRARGCDRRRAIEGQPVDGFDGRSGVGMADPRHPGNRPPLRRLRLHQRPGTKGIAAVRRQAMVKDVQDPGHRPSLCHTSLNAASTPIG